MISSRMIVMIVDFLHGVGSISDITGGSPIEVIQITKAVANMEYGFAGDTALALFFVYTTNPKDSICCKCSVPVEMM